MRNFLTMLAVSLLLGPGLVLAQQKDMDMDMGAAHGTAMGMAHHAAGMVKSLDSQTGKVAVAHGPVKSLDWPAMTMVFVVRDPALLPKFKLNQKVDFEFVQEGKDYVVTKVN